mmetsp:Transcript_36417/g.55908  ORF Transcript_36417/g.55908 Transcript_36417/m.55908 type:complete len:106 (+) Transcript_36417:1611-1928(+)
MQQPQPAGTTPQIPLLNLPQVDIGEFEKHQGEDQRTFVGNHIYRVIEEVLTKDYAPTITGMLLDPNNGIDLKQLISDNQYFTQQVTEAYKLLQQANQGPAQETAQ